MQFHFSSRTSRLRSNPDDYGTQVLFSAWDGTYYSGNVQVSFTINRVDDDISLNEPSSSIDITWQEKDWYSHDFVHLTQIQPQMTRIDNNASSTEGAKIYYSITGNDAEFLKSQAMVNSLSNRTGF